MMHKGSRFVRYNLLPFACVLSVFIFVNTSVWANNVYELTGVTISRSVSETEVSTQNTTQTTLRETAMQELMQTGYRKFLQRITPQNVWPQHTWLMAQLPIKQAIESVSITREETFPKYILEATLKFNREKIREILTQNNIAFHETSSSAVLVIPVYEVGQLRVLWEENNPWRDALRTTLLKQGGLRLTLPAGDIQEVSSLTANMAILGAQDVLTTIAQKYKVDAVVVSRLNVQQRPNDTRYTVQNTWYNLNDDTTKSLSLNQYGKGGEILTQELTQTAAQTYSLLEEHWRSGQTVATGRVGTVFIRIETSAPKDSFKLHKTLQTLPTVKNAIPRVLQKGHARFQVNYFGKERQLTQALKQAGYNLERVAGGWRVSNTKAITGAAVVETQEESLLTILPITTDEFVDQPTHTQRQPEDSLKELILRQGSEFP